MSAPPSPSRSTSSTPSAPAATIALSPAGHVALFVRALHAPGAAALRRHTGEPGLVEACAVTRGGDGRPRPHRSGRARAVSPLRRHRRPAGAGPRDQGRRPGVLVLRPAADRARGGRQGGAGRDGAVGRRRHPGHAVARPRPARAPCPCACVVESGGAADPDEPRWHLYLAASRWLAADELEAANARLAELLGGDRVGDRGRLMRLPGTRNLKGGGPGRWCRVVACDLHAPALDVESVVGTLRPTRAAPRATHAARADSRDSTSSPRGSGSHCWSPTGRSASTATRAVRCTTTTSPRSSSTTRRATAGTAGRARAAVTSSSTRPGGATAVVRVTSTPRTTAGSASGCGRSSAQAAQRDMPG